MNQIEFITNDTIDKIKDLLNEINFLIIYNKYNEFYDLEREILNILTKINQGGVI